MEYDCNGEEVEYGPDDWALPKVCPHAPKGALACLAAYFDQGASQVNVDPPNSKAGNSHIDPHLGGDTLADSTVVTAQAS